MMAPLNDSILPSNSLILVTGANGLIASHVVDQLLIAGFRVRGTVRDASKHAWLAPLFNGKYGEGKFELVEVPDLQKNDAWDGVFADGQVAGVAHCAGSVDVFLASVTEATNKEARANKILFDASVRAGSVKSIVLASSAWAAFMPKANTRRTVTAETWNDEAVDLANDTSVPDDSKGFAKFMAAKVGVERAAWEWVREKQPALRFNALLIDTVIGPSVDVHTQGLTSTAGFVAAFWNGQMVDMIVNSLQPQWYIATEDVGKLFVGALTVPGVDRERLFGFAGRYEWREVLKIMREIEPERKELQDVDDRGVDQTDVPNQKAEDLVKKVGGKGWVSLAEAVRLNVKSAQELAK